MASNPTPRTPGTKPGGGVPEKRVYAIGFGLAATLTGFAFYATITHALSGTALAAAIVVLAIAQMGVHLVFFLHLDSSPDHNTNIAALVFTLLIVAMVVLGTLWIMGHLADNMMPMNKLMEMQR